MLLVCMGFVALSVGCGDSDRESDRRTATTAQRTATTPDAGLPSAIGAKIVSPKASMMAICGDGGFMMNSQELETAVRLELDIVVLVLRDDAYGMIKWKQAGMGLPSVRIRLRQSRLREVCG